MVQESLDWMMKNYKGENLFCIHRLIYRIHPQNQIHLNAHCLFGPKNLQIKYKHILKY